MKRRGRHSSVVSLFAFQDVMASVIGVLFVVVLLMALDIVRARSPDAAATPDRAAEVQSLLARVRELQGEVASLRKTAERNVEKVNLVSQDETEILEAINKLRQALKTKYALIEQGDRDSARLDERLASTRRELERRKADAKAVRDLLSKLKKQVKRRPTVPRIAYIVDSPSYEPWLVEVGGDRLRAAAKDGSSAVVAFRAETFGARKRHLLAWAKTQNSRTHYFVLLIKPSGIDQARELGADLKKMGFHIGTDLLPEDWRAFD